MISYRNILHTIGLLTCLFSLTLLPSLGISYWNNEANVSVFLACCLGLAAFGVALVLLTRKRPSLQNMGPHTGYMIVASFWLVLGAMAALPMYFSLLDHNISFTDALFEAISGVTTTGATVLSNLEHLPASVLMYRQILQWAGGLGIIMLAVAVLPTMRPSVARMYQAESAGHNQDSTYVPRVADTVKLLWAVYLILTLTCFAGYWAAGMSVFDAIGHAFSTVSIGGFSTYDASIGHFDNPFVESIAIIFMLISGMSFALHYAALSNFSFTHYFRNSEWRFYLLAISLLTAITVLALYMQSKLSLWGSVRYGLFQVVSFSTTTGYTSSSHTLLPSVIPFLLLLGAFMGGCAGSTGGGIKVIRVMVLLKKSWLQVRQLVHPAGVFPMTIGNLRIRDTVVEAIVGFLIIYVLIFFVVLIGLLLCSMDFYSAFSATSATLNNLGPGLGEVGTNYSTISDTAKLILCLAMILGRLEIMALLVLFTRAFWRA